MCCVATATASSVLKMASVSGGRIFLWSILCSAIGTVLGVIIHMLIGGAVELLYTLVYPGYPDGITVAGYWSEAFRWFAKFGSIFGAIIGCVAGLISGVGAVQIAAEQQKKMLLVIVCGIGSVMIKVCYIIYQGIETGHYEYLFYHSSIRGNLLYLAWTVLPTIVTGVVHGFAIGGVSLVLLTKANVAGLILGITGPAGTTPAAGTIGATEGHQLAGYPNDRTSMLQASPC